MSEDSAAGDAPTADGAPSLRRSRRHRVVGGVCAGLGQYFDLDPVIFRVVLALLGATGGLGLLVYGAAWLFVPARGEARNEAQRMLSGQVGGQGMAAVLTALAGCGVFLSTIGKDGGRPFPLLVSAVVVGAVYGSQRRRHGDGTPGADGAAAAGAADAPPAAQPPPAPGAPPWWREGFEGWGQEGFQGVPPPYRWGPADGPEEEREPAPEQPRERRSPLPFTVAALAALACAAGTSLTWPRPLGTSLQTGLACALAVFGAALLAGNRSRALRGGTVFLALATGGLLVLAAALPKSIGHDWQTRTWRPASAAGLQPRYEIGAGSGELDLTGLDPRGRALAVTARIGAGHLVVRVPDTVRVRVRATTGLGVIRLPGDRADEEAGDIDVTLDDGRTAVLAPTAPRRERRDGTLRLDLDVRLGQVEVTVESP